MLSSRISHFQIPSSFHVHGVWTKCGVGHGLPCALPYGLPVVRFLKHSIAANLSTLPWALFYQRLSSAVLADKKISHKYQLYCMSASGLGSTLCQKAYRMSGEDSDARYIKVLNIFILTRGKSGSILNVNQMQQHCKTRHYVFASLGPSLM